MVQIVKLGSNVREVECHNCKSTLGYTPRDIETMWRRAKWTHEYERVEVVKCPVCSEAVET